MFERTHLEALFGSCNFLPSEVERWRANCLNSDSLLASKVIDRLDNEMRSVVFGQVLSSALHYSEHGNASLARNEITVDKQHALPATSVLAEYVSNATQNGLAALHELAERLDRDKLTLERQGICFSNLASEASCIQVSKEMSDAHDHGRVVRVLSVNSTRWIYKPRPVTSEKIYFHICERLTQICLSDLEKKPWIIDQGEYGWMEFVEHSTTINPAEVEEYYFRAGSICAIATLLGATDLHYENIVACGVHPVVVDAEGLMQPTAFGVNQSLKFSILRTGLIGLRGNRHGKNDDWSGITFARRAPIGTAVGAMLSEEGSLRIFTKHRTVAPYTNYPQNRPLTLSEASQCRKSFVAGFLNCRNKISAARADIVDIINEALKLHSDYKSRVILRPTRDYYIMRERFLSNSYEITHGVPLDRDVDNRIFASEKSSLARGDIPNFFVPLDSEHLHDCRGEIVSRKFFSNSPRRSQFDRLDPNSEFFCKSDQDIVIILNSIL